MENDPQATITVLLPRLGNESADTPGAGRMNVKLHAVVGDRTVRVETAAGVLVDVSVLDELWDTLELLRVLGGIQGFYNARAVIRADANSPQGWVLTEILEQKPASAADN